MSYDLLDRVYSIMIDVMTGVSAGSGNAVFYNTDSHTSFIEVSITNGTQSFNMSEYNYQLVISKPDKTGYNNSYTTTDNSKLVIALDSDMLSGIGNNIAQLYVMKTINDVSKVVTMIEFNYTVKAGNYSALAPESVNHDSMYIALRTDVDSILSKIENGELGGGSGGTGLTTTQAEQLTTAYNHSQSPHITTADVNNAVSTYVTAHKEELKGDKGDKGDAGEKGDTGAKGEKGDTGAKGDKGDKGDTGATGANGITPTLKGNAGTNASVTMTDNNNVYTLNFVIPKGEKGDTGAKGDAGVKGQDGAKGADGITPTLKVGTVTTLAAGSNANVTMTESNNEYTLNFGIPKGAKGDTGASGSGGSSSVANSEWSGKVASFLGDSITYGANTTKIYHQYLKELVGFSTCNNYGIDGASITNHSNGICTRYNNVSSDSDIIFIFGGTNDFYYNKPLGGWYSLVGTTRTLNKDMTTFRGALAEICDGLITKFPTKQIVLMTPIHRFTFGSQQTDLQANASGLYLDDYVECVKEAGKIFGIPVIDLNGESGLYPMNTENANAYFHANDKLHPNANGHLKIARVIQGKLRTILPLDINYTPNVYGFFYNI